MPRRSRVRQANDGERKLALLSLCILQGQGSGRSGTRRARFGTWNRPRAHHRRTKVSIRPCTFKRQGERITTQESFRQQIIQWRYCLIVPAAADEQSVLRRALWKAGAFEVMAVEREIREREHQVEHPAKPLLRPISGGAAQRFQGEGAGEGSSSARPISHQ